MIIIRLSVNRGLWWAVRLTEQAVRIPSTPLLGIPNKVSARVRLVALLGIHDDRLSGLAYRSEFSD